MHAAFSLAFVRIIALDGGMPSLPTPPPLLYGPYRAPNCKVGGTLTCAVRGKRLVVAISTAPIPWPMTAARRYAGRRFQIVCGGLQRAVERESGKVSAHVLQKLMRHANIKTTMDYYANVDAAVEEAVLGPQCNSLRNNQPSAAAPIAAEIDATPSDDTSNSFSAS
jgi:hypothetical protein